jgi:hypothetical protein
MCFVLYVGTTNPLPRRKFDEDSLGLSVEPLTDRDAGIKQYFGNPEVQYVGSTSGCGCDFPHATLQNGQWPEIEYTEEVEKDDLEIARDVSGRQNREALVLLLRMTGDKMIELYGVWDGGNEAFTKSPQAHESISLNRILDSDFRFKEQGFYSVHMEDPMGR